ncbi:MAG: CDP-6-deoxy-delta-3,4-glucoseen reductase [Candidatus Competibacteraceae bacterium]|nr:CDP-6-deoxy-delta-3,4-glucoseen reductase [Candidatus Competibacteraceae bacterium]MCP5125766.1 CDP-6-deoxy-delta-3,4-glucoseen reductase [Gammaproteobacteria bacterium]HRX71337.1 CDP-6-deoxy-delta-3,4-glucoseen reductase [Candidatus Competibacteraceae bacterium]
MPYHVTIQPSGHEFQVADHESVLDAALREKGSVLPYGCRNGTCGSCMGTLLSGQVVYPEGRPPALSEREETEGKALLCQARPASNLVIEAREVKTCGDIPVKILPCRVEQRELLAPDVMRLYLRLPSAERLQFLAGQYIDILLADGRRRGFSLANPPHADDLLELHIRHVPGGFFTGYIFERMKDKALLRFQGPLGTFFLREDSPRPVILMGGGTGFAPLKGMLEHAFHIGWDRPLHLYWGARAKVDLYLDALPRRWIEEQTNFRYTPVLSEPHSEDDWQGRTGWVHEAVAVDYPDLSGYDVYMSGPPPMIEAAKPVFAAQGLSAEQLFYDSFDFSAQ